MSGLMQFIDRTIWYLFLALLVFVSFVQTNYGSGDWYLISCVCYCLCAVVFLRMTQANAKQYNIKALISAKTSLLIFSLMLVYLLLQMFIPYESSLYDRVFQPGATPIPDWFNPIRVLSVTPALTYDLFWSELTMFSAFFLGIVLISSRRRLKQVIFVIFIVGLIHALVGVFAKFSSILLVDAAQVDGHFSVARGWFINRNHYAAFIGLTLVSALSYQLKWVIAYRGNNYLFFLSSQLLSIRVSVIIAIVLSFLALSLSQSRAGFFAVFIAMFGVLAITGGQSKAFGKRRWIFLGLFTTAILIVYYSGSELMTRLHSNELMLGERLPQWSLTWALIQQEWLFGYGGNSYATVFQSTRGDAELREVIYAQAHNDYLHILLEQGLIGALLWLGLISAIFKHAWAVYFKASSSLVSGVILSAMVVISAALLQSIVGFNLQILSIRFYFFIIIALTFAAPKIHNRAVKPTS